MNIGIVGKYGSGKTTVSNYIIKEYGYKRFSLADPLKWILKEFLDIEDKSDPRYRKTIQTVGTEWFRSIDDLVWVKYLMKRVKRSHAKAVCDDVRFVNEADTLLKNGWLLFYLNCPEKIRRKRCLDRDGTFDESTLNHPSETGVDDIVKKLGADMYLITIDASRSLQEVFSEIDWALAKYDIHKNPWIGISRAIEKKRGELSKLWPLRIGRNESSFTKNL